MGPPLRYLPLNRWILKARLHMRFLFLVSFLLLLFCFVLFFFFFRFISRTVRVVRKPRKRPPRDLIALCRRDIARVLNLLETWALQQLNRVSATKIDFVNVPLVPFHSHIHFLTHSLTHSFAFYSMI